jgi:pimeloyl-ACP methyl ester carboxylesterase
LSKTSGDGLVMLAVTSEWTTGDSAMTQHTSRTADPHGRFVRIDDGDMHVVEDGKPDGPALLLIHGSAASLVCWDPVVPSLAGAFRVIRVDLLGCGRSTTPAGGYEIPAQARRVAAALDELGVRRATVIGHSSGCTVATALAEQRPDTVPALVLIDFGPSMEAKVPDRRLFRLLQTQFPGRLLWRMRNEANIRKAVRASGGFTRPVDIPDAFIEDALRMTHRTFVEMLRAPVSYLEQRSLPDRLSALGLPLLVVFGTDDQRWRPSSAHAFSVVPGSRVELLSGVGHTPMMEDPQATARLLLEFFGAVEARNEI